MSRVLPILFNTEMVRAILREVSPKTATRRCVKGYIPPDAVWGYTMFSPKGYISCRGTFSGEHGEKFFKLPCQKGDILYVRETWCEWTGGYLYKAWAEETSLPGAVGLFKWRPSIHMPKEAARIWLRVTDVRVERLQDISNFASEGIPRGTHETAHMNFYDEMCDFKILWNSTIKKSELDLYRWEANPWVWVIEFERCEKPEE